MRVTRASGRSYPRTKSVVALVGLVLAAGGCQPTFHERYGGAGNDLARFVREAPDGDLVFGGRVGAGDGLLLRTDGAGFERWSRSFGAGGSDGFESALLRSDGGALVAGVEAGNAGDAWLVAVGQDGAEIESLTYPGPALEQVVALAATPDHGVILAGNLLAGTPEGFDHWALLIKLDASYGEEWRQYYGGPDQPGLADVVATQDGGYVFVGSQADGGGSTQAWLVKVDGSGALQWERRFPSTYAAASVVATDDGGFAIGAAAAPGNLGAVLLRTDAHGDEEWRRSYGDPDFNVGEMASTLEGGFAFGGTKDSALHLLVADAAGNRIVETTLDRGSLGYAGADLVQTRDGGFAVVSTCKPPSESNHDLCLAKTDALGRSAPAPG